MVSPSAFLIVEERWATDVNCWRACVGAVGEWSLTRRRDAAAPHGRRRGTRWRAVYSENWDVIEVSTVVMVELIGGILV
jgi:hypothetical protein